MTLIRLGPDTSPAQRHYRPEAPAPRMQVSYRCSRNHDFEVTFAAGADLPETWACRCAASAHRAGSAPSMEAVSSAEAEHERHRKHVHERRTPAERKQILADRLAEVAAVRAAGQR